MEAQYNLSTGVLECYPSYAVFHFTGQQYDMAEAAEFTTVIDTHYKDRQCVVIASRAMTKNINPEVYSKYGSKSVVAIAIVSTSEEVREQAVEEQALYKGAFTFFQDMEHAICWAETVIKPV
jgi:hypothetical protein